MKKNFLKLVLIPLACLTVACGQTNNPSEAQSSIEEPSTNQSSQFNSENSQSQNIPASTDVQSQNTSLNSQGQVSSSNVQKSEEPVSSLTQQNSSQNKPSSQDKPSSSSQSSSSSQKVDITGLPSDMTKSRGYPAEKQGDIYLSPTGNDSNTGSKESPLYSLSIAIQKAVPGTTIFMAKGQYNYSSTIQIKNSGTAEKPIVIQAMNWEEVILDFKGIPYGFNNNGWGIKLQGNYWHFQGLTLQYAGDNAIKVEGSHNYIGRCITHHNGDTGIQLGFGHHTNKDNNGELCAYNTIENCDSYKNYDFDNHGDADGFACKMHNGKNNVFLSCRAWENCDDAWDLYETNYSVYIVNCWAFNTAKKDAFNDFDPAYLSKNGISFKGVGNGNGIKLGGNGAGGNSEGQHYVYNCVSFNNNITTSVKGFDENSHGDGNIILNCVAWDNGYNYMFENGGPKTTLKNNISFYTLDGNKSCKPGRLAGETSSGTIVENNNFYLDGGDLAQTSETKSLSKDDFITCRVEDAKAPRQSDGSLPNNGFAKLRPTSSLYGKNMGLAY